VLGLATAPMAATKGEFNNMCTQGLALGKDVPNEQAKTDFMKDPEGNLAKAQAYYASKHHE
jgi:hypothetical protein